jgi:hypothetical protein
MAFFKNTPHHAMKSSGNNKANLTTPPNRNTMKASTSKPAPLKTGCASCGKKR